MNKSVYKVSYSIAKLILFSCLCVNLLSSCGWSKKRKESLADSVYEVIPKYKYGICVDSFFVYHSIVGQDVNLSQILTRFGVSQNKINELGDKSQSVFDVRKMKAGNVFAIFLDLDTARTVKYFVYEISPVEYLMCEFGDSMKVYLEQKKVRTIEQTAKGTIESSLWNCITSNKINPVLATELSEIYAWSIDFFALQKGDHFKVIYNESFVDSMSVGVTEIKAVVFNHMGEDIYAIPYEQDGKLGYFDDKGKSLKKAFLKAPLKFSRITSYFSKARFHPILRIFRPHWGVDYKAPIGTPVQTISDGVVIKIGYSGGAGNLIRIKHSNGFESAYMHLSGFPKGVRLGSHVHQGQIIGLVGSTGLSTGPHLDFRIYKDSKPVDPLKVKSPPTDPVKKSDMAAFTIKADVLKQMLDKH
jgi:murein DD-endopeptidase MepM/ murein hydrolase activator NlpD